MMNNVFALSKQKKRTVLKDVNCWTEGSSSEMWNLRSSSVDV